MTVKKFMQRIKQINNLFPVMPLSEETTTEEDRIDGFTEAELRNILKKASPREWRETQEKSNIRFDSVSAQVQYYEKLRNMDERKLSSRNKDSSRHNRNNDSKNNQNSNKNDKNNHRTSELDAPCPIHGGRHTIGQCNVIKEAKKQYNDKRNQNNNGSGRESGSSNNDKKIDATLTALLVLQVMRIIIFRQKIKSQTVEATLTTIIMPSKRSYMY